jgi:hypothetical protein
MESLRDGTAENILTMKRESRKLAAKIQAARYRCTRVCELVLPACMGLVAYWANARSDLSSIEPGVDLLQDQIGTTKKLVHAIARLKGNSPDSSTASRICNFVGDVSPDLSSLHGIVAGLWIEDLQGERRSPSGCETDAVFAIWDDGG